MSDSPEPQQEQNQQGQDPQGHDPLEQERPLPKPPGRLRNALSWIGAGILAVLIMLFLVGLGAGAMVVLPIGKNVAPQTLIVPRGTSVQGIAQLLSEKDIAPCSLLFRAVARFVAQDKLHAGEYQFLPTQNMVDIVVMMRDGLSIIRRFTVPEGLTSEEIVQLLENEQALSGPVGDTPPEGTLLPETYHFTYGDLRADMLARMKVAHKDLLHTLWEARDPDVKLDSPEAAVVMASMVERETGKKAEERARVAGVFFNRLATGMRLQSDPTVIYALTKGKGTLGRDLTHDDLSVASPYNTYANAGLPPGPICNPGRASLVAALHPEKNDFLYFVADGTGGHAFSKDLESHNKNVTRWHGLSKP